MNQLLVLMLVPVAWGTYGPSVKELYALDAPPPELLFSVLSYVVSVCSLVAVSAIRAASRKEDLPERVPGAGDSTQDAVPAGRGAALAGLELGGYLFVGSTIQIFGMQCTTAGRAAFIVQLTTVIVPLLEAALKRTAPSRETVGLCALAFVGVALLVTAGASGGATLPSTMLGDGLIGCSAIAYSMHVVRLSYHAPRLPPVALARAKEASRLVYATATLAAGLAFAPAQADALAAFAASFTSAPAAAATALAIIVWNGLVTTAFPTWAQSYGQAAVSAGTASIVYATQPLWSALFGYALLGETFGPQALCGAAVILAAVVLAAGRKASTIRPAPAVTSEP